MAIVILTWYWFISQGSDDQLEIQREKLPFAKLVHQTELWATFLDVMQLARPDSLLAEADSFETPVIGIDQVEIRTPRLDTVHLSRKSLKVSQAAHALMVNAIPDFLGLVNYRNHSQGIVSVGGGSYMSVLLVSIRLLRRTHSHLPVEVFLPEEDYDHYICDVVMKGLNAQCVMFPKFENFTISRYQYKAFAILFSSFEDVLFLDADNFPVIDPSELFGTDPYVSTGLVTWPDYWASTASPLYYRIAVKEKPHLFERATTESGQILISKRKQAQTILLVAYYNAYGPALFYKLFSQNGPGEGDKETFIAAAKVFNMPFYQVREYVGTLGFHENDTFHGIAMTQHDPFDDYKRELTSSDSVVYRRTPDAKVVFVHHNILKLNPQNLLQHLDLQRIWGSKDTTVAKFGHDLEAAVWEEVIYVGCEIGPALREWKRQDVCEELKFFWNAVLSKEKEGLGELE